MSLFDNVMKMGKMTDLGSVAQKVAGLAGDALPQSGGAGAAKIAELETQTAKLALTVRTLYEVCSQKGVFTDDEFNAKFKELDLMDGVEDGK